MTDREAFEKWAIGEGGYPAWCLVREGDYYRGNTVSADWTLWQAARATAEQSEPVAWMLETPGQSTRWYTSGRQAMEHWVKSGAVATPLCGTPQAAAQNAVAMPEGYIELNMSNYDADDVSRLNEWAIAAYGALESAQKYGDPIRALIAVHAEQLEQNDYAYFELAYTRHTAWMAWLCSNSRDDDPNRKVLAKGQGHTPEEACAAAISGDGS